MTTTILVTGGAGYIGSHTCKALRRAGYLPLTLDSLVRGSAQSVKWGPFVHGDTRDGPLLDRLFVEHRPRAVLHFAAFAYVGESVAHPEEYYSNNLLGTLSLLQAMRRHGCSSFVFSSTCATYGCSDKPLITEETPQEPVNPYGRSKLMAEQILRDFAAAYGTKYVSLRYFNAAGADADGEIGECHDPETHLIPLAIETALGNRPELEVYGVDYPTPDGSAVRDYIHVTDLAEAHIQALDYLLKGGESRELNLGTGTGHSVFDVVKTVERIAGTRIKVKRAARRSGDPPVLVAGVAHAERVLGWHPRYRSLESIIRSAWDWHSKQPLPEESTEK